MLIYVRSEVVMVMVVVEVVVVVGGRKGEREEGTGGGEGSLVGVTTFQGQHNKPRPPPP